MTLDVDIHLVDSIDEVWALKNWMSERRPFLAVDTETEGLQWWRHRPRMLQVGDRNTAWAIPWHLYAGAILEVLRDFDGDLVMHNAKFDIQMFEHWSGVKLPRHRIHDTRIQAHLLDPSRPSGLKYLAERLVDRQAAVSERIKDEAMALHGYDWATVPCDFQPYWVYAGMDVILTSRLHEILYPQVMAECPEAYRLEIGTQITLINMEQRGVALNLDLVRATRERYLQYVDETADWIKHEYHGISAGSDVQIIDYLKRQYGVEFTKMTASGKRHALDRDVLFDLVNSTDLPSGARQLVKAVYMRRRVQRLVSAYLDNFLDLEHNGRLHPSFNPLSKDDKKSRYGARTGRMSVGNPSLQNLPRMGNFGAADAIRRCITASEGHVLLMSDFDQIEFRVMAHLSKDGGLIRAFDEGDFFVNLAREIYADPTIQKKDPRRQPTKNAAYAKIYGAGAAKFAKTALIKEEVALAIMQRLDTLYPKVQWLIQQIEKTARKRLEEEGVAYVRSTLTGRRFVADEDRLYALVNYLIQGEATEILKTKLSQHVLAGTGETTVLLVHDEFIFDVEEDDAPEFHKKIEDVMNDDDMLQVPIRASLDAGVNWGQKKEAKEAIKRGEQWLVKLGDEAEREVQVSPTRGPH